MSTSALAPTVDAADIAQLGGTADIGGNQGHAWSNRPRQGQSFTTGSDAGGYTLHAISVATRVDQASTLAPNWELRVGTLDGSSVFSALVTESIAGATIPGGNNWVTWTLATPLPLNPNSLYAYDVYPDGGGFISQGAATDVLPGGSAYSSGSPGSAAYPASPPNAITTHGSDRAFHVDIEATANPGVAVLANAAATAITTSGATLNGEVLDIGDGAASITIRWGDEDGGSDPGAWDHAESLPGTHGVGAFSAPTTSPLAPNTTYFFTAFATNPAGDSVASPSLSFTTLPAAPAVINLAASQVSADAATVGATVTDTGGEAPTLFIYWGTVDEGTNAGAWANSVLLGAQAATATADLRGLAGATTYYFRAFATNNGGSAWAPATASFTTETPQPPSVANRSANGITGSSANLRGEVTNSGFADPVITIFYGDTDGGTNPAAWGDSVNLGVRSGEFSFFATGLEPLSQYFFRARATNSAGTSWAASTESFTTTELTATTIVINEIHYDHDPKTERGEFVELFNAGDSPVDVSNWSLRGAVDFQFAPGTAIAANGFLVVAEDPASLLAAFGAAAVGPYAGKLSNDGERLRLEDASGATVDAVDYGVGFPWPSASRGEGASMELINASLDNDLGSSWRSSQSGFAGPQATYVAPAAIWRYRPGTSEASDPPGAWRLGGFTEDATWLSGQTVIGFGDNDDTTVLTGMQNNYTTVFLRKQFQISGAIPSQLLVRVYYDDGAIVWINGVEVARLDVDLGDITYQGIRASDPPGGTPGAAIGSHESTWVDVTVPGAAGFLVAGTNTIAIHAFNTGLGSSDFSIDCEVKTPDPSNAAIGAPTPGFANSVFSPNAPPNIRQVDHTPQQPTSGQDVVLSAKVTDPDGVASVTLSYQLVDPGAYIRLTDAAYETAWTDLPMLDDGTGGDNVVGDAVYSATLPGALQQHRRLVRYRITVEDSQGSAVQTPYADDEAPNFAYFCYDGVPDWTASKRPGMLPAVTYPAAALDSVAVYHLISREEDVIACQWTGPNDGVYRYLGTLVYDGKVYDHMRYRIRGNASTRQVGRNKWKFNFTRTHPLEARDNYGKKYKVPLDKINVLPGSNPWWRNNASTEGTMFCESLGFRAYQLAGGTGSNTHFFHFRVIDAANEAPAADQYGGDFWGLYISIEQPEAEFLNERGLPDGNLYNVHGGTGSSKRNQGATQNTDYSDLLAFQGLHNTGTSQAQWEANLDFDAYFAFNAMNLAINNSDMRPQENVNYYHNPETGKWLTLPWDLDLTFEDAPHLGRGDTAAWENIYRCLQYPAINQAYQNRVREILDLLLDNDQSAQLTDEFAGFMTRGGTDNLVEASQAMWDYHPRKVKKGIWYANFNPTLLPSRDFAALTQYTKDFLTVGGYGREKLAAKQADTAIPNKPTITYAGTAGFPTAGLAFTSSAFSDPQGAGSFGSMEWRVGRVHNPSTPGYVAGDRYAYEIEDAYQSQRLAPFAAAFTFPASAVRVGNTYRARVRHIDATGKASHWSEPVEFTASEPDVTPWRQDLMITEIMYHPRAATPAEIAAGFSTSRFEFIELKNVSDTRTLDLSELRFTKGVDFDFDSGSITSLAPGEFVLIVANLAAFEARYGGGIPVAGEWDPSDSLSNGGETLKLSFGAGSAIHEFAFDDEPDWPTSPDGAGPSLTLIAPESRPPHADPFSWRPSVAVGGSPGTSDAVAFSGDPDADNDNDRSSAFLEHALGTSDDLADTTGLPIVGVGRYDDGGGTLREYVTFSHQRNLAADDVSYEIQRSTDLTPGRWLSADAIAFVSMTDHGDGTATMIWRSTTPHAEAEREFLRLLVQTRP